MIKNFTPRLYQETILSTCIEKNTMVVLPTGMGKTNIFLMLAAHRLQKFPDSKIMLLGPTRPLINQYYESFKKHFDIVPEKMVVFTGFVSPEKRAEQAKDAKIIFSTPQGLENDIITNRIDLSQFSLIGFDEAHRATGEYSYVWIAEQYNKRSKNPLIVAMTASPGSDLETISEVCKNLYIDAVEVRTDEDPDVKPYIHEVKISWIYLELPTVFMEIKKFLEDCFNSKIKELKALNPEIKTDVLSKRELLGIQGALHVRIAQGKNDFDAMRSVSVLAEAMKVSHAIELLETQSISSLSEYLEDIVAQARTSRVKAVLNLVQDLNFRSALIKTRTVKELNLEHPKIAELKKIIADTLQKTPDAKIIVFSQYRDSVSKIVEEINKVFGANARIFVGQAKKKDTGLSQKKQIAMLKEFETGDFNVICMTSVGEEGLDIPSVNTVVFYEPIPSAIRTIQRKGRTGRHDSGNIVVLVAKGTRDEAYRWAAFHKEKNMYKILEKLKERYEVQRKEAQTFLKSEKEILIYADYREKASGVIKKLIDMGASLKLDTLEVGDYLLSSRVAVEIKTVPDFVDSILDKRLLEQVKNIRKYEAPFLIVEGSEDIYAQRNVNPNVICGMLASIIIDFRVPVIFTKTPEETARLLHMIARREQEAKDSGFTFHSAKPASIKEQQEYIVSALPGVGGVLSKPLLEMFGTVKDLVNATEEELKQVELIGDKKAAKIREILDADYRK